MELYRNGNIFTIYDELRKKLENTINKTKLNLEKKMINVYVVDMSAIQTLEC